MSGPRFQTVETCNGFVGPPLSNKPCQARSKKHDSDPRDDLVCAQHHDKYSEQGRHKCAGENCHHKPEHNRVTQLEEACHARQSPHEHDALGTQVHDACALVDDQPY